MNIQEFAAKWRAVELKERSAAQEHFLDLCALVGHDTPAKADPTGDWFTFERGAEKHGGGDGWADVWKKGFFGWEYKGKHKDLDVAYDQLLQYREALENPPLLVVCDMDRIVVRTNFTGTPTVVHKLPISSLNEPRSIEILNAIFHDPEKLRPGATSAAITREAAERLADIAQSLRDRAVDPRVAAHFLDRIVFCLFAEDIGLLPEMIFTKLVEKSHSDPERFTKLVQQLFDAMADGGDFGLETIRHFNGNLFDKEPVVDLIPDEMLSIAAAASLDWSSVDPSIFGTLFERGMDPAKRSQLGAHYTSREDIETLVDPVIMQPLRREWAEVQATVQSLLTTGRKQLPKPPPKRPPSEATLKKARGEARMVVHRFLTRLQHVTVLDPACGSGNFLYVTLQKLKDLEKEIIIYAMDELQDSFLPAVGPWQLYGIEKSPYAHDLAQMTVWIGFLQWTKVNGFRIAQDPILRPMEANFQCRDAILDLSDPDHPKEPEWPKVDFIIGNPPFLHGSKLVREIGEAYRASLFTLYEARVPGFADLCCYWFEKARAHITDGNCGRAGLLATQGIRGGASREVLKRINETGGIFWAESDRPWLLDGANVHVSMVAFDDRSEATHTLDGERVTDIHANLTAVADTTRARSLSCNTDLCFYGSQQKAPFDLDEPSCIEFLLSPNPHGRPNSDVLFPSINAAQLVRGGKPTWVVDFGLEKDVIAAAHYEAPFTYVQRVIKPLRENHREKGQAKYWWLHARPSPRYRAVRAKLGRIVLSPCVSKYRLFVFIGHEVLADHATVAFSRPDDLFFGVLHSRFHEVWALHMGTRLETRPRYTPSTCFETFPFPEGVLNPSDELPDSLAAIAVFTNRLTTLREGWLNPAEWTREEILEFPATVGGPWDRYIDPDTVTDRGTFKVGTVRYPRLAPRDDKCAVLLKKRTLTNLYNARPTWLDLAHKALDEAVAAAYGWPPDLTDDQILEKLLALNLERAEA